MVAKVNMGRSYAQNRNRQMYRRLRLATGPFDAGCERGDIECRHDWRKAAGDAGSHPSSVRRPLRRLNSTLVLQREGWAAAYWNFDSMEVNAPFVSDKTIKPVARAFAAFLL